MSSVVFPPPYFAVERQDPKADNSKQNCAAAYSGICQARMRCTTVPIENRCTRKWLELIFWDDSHRYDATYPLLSSSKACRATLTLVPADIYYMLSVLASTNILSYNWSWGLVKYKMTKYIRIIQTYLWFYSWLMDNLRKESCYIAGANIRGSLLVRG